MGKYLKIGNSLLSQAILTYCTTLPVVVPGVRLGDRAPALHTDHGHSLRSLYLPPAALPSFPLPYHLYADGFELLVFGVPLPSGSLSKPFLTD